MHDIFHYGNGYYTFVKSYKRRGWCWRWAKAHRDAVIYVRLPNGVWEAFIHEAFGRYAYAIDAPDADKVLDKA